MVGGVEEVGEETFLLFSQSEGFGKRGQGHSLICQQVVVVLPSASG